VTLLLAVVELVRVKLTHLIKSCLNARKRENMEIKEIFT